MHRSSARNRVSNLKFKPAALRFFSLCLLFTVGHIASPFAIENEAKFGVKLSNSLQKEAAQEKGQDAKEKPAKRFLLEDREPEAATGFEQKESVSGAQYMVAAANPYASWAGKRIIEQGGSAIDAAIAVQSMLTLVEPQSSGIGGGAFIMYWDNKNKKLHTYDGREVAPSGVNPYLFVKDGEPMSWREAVVGGKSVGVPGVLRALEMAHQDFGKLNWSELFRDTIKQASEGFIVSPRLARLIELDLHPGVNDFISTKNYFKPNGIPVKEGELKTNIQLANTLSEIAENGADAFYTGDIAEKIALAVQTVITNSSVLSVDDLANYKAIKRSAMCNKYRVYKICGMAPPSSGGVTVYQILKTLERFDLGSFGANSLEFAHLFAQASALAFADRSLYVADLDYMNISPVPLVSPAYLKERSQQISLVEPMRVATPGKPYSNVVVGKDNAMELMSTSHIAIVDKEGNAVSMTSSIEFMFGSGIMVEGFLLNNQLTDFSINPMDGDLPVLNRVQAGKRPRSSMSPTMVFDENNNLKLVVGSPGGSRIINYVAHTLINVLDFGLNIQEAIDLPRITNRNDRTTLEKGTEIESLSEQLKALGHSVRIGDLNSGLHGVEIKNGKLIGGADPRREGVAVGF